MTIAVHSHQQLLDVQCINTPTNVRELHTEHVNALAVSIALQGLLVPIVVRDAGDGRYQLVAGFHRFAAVQQLGAAVIDQVPVVVRDAGHEDADRAVENITRKQLRPDEEARALAAMLARGYSEDGAAQALGWTKARVTARVKLLALPDRAVTLVGAGVIALSAVEQLLAIGRVSAPLLDAVIAHVETDPWVAERLTRQPGWVIDAAAREANGKVFVAHLTSVEHYDIKQLKLGKKPEALWETAGELCKQLDRYSYGPTVRFGDAEVDQARAAGVTIEFESGAPLIADRTLYRELVKQAIARTVSELEQKLADRETERQQSRSLKRTDPADLAREARRDRDRQLRELAEQAHGVNVDVGTSLLNGLSTVDPDDIDVARFFVYGLLGADWNSNGYRCNDRDIRVLELAVSGIRLVIDEFRADVTKTRKDGSRGKLRIAYGDAHATKTIEPPVKWLWRYIDAAKTAGELYGRALVVIAAQQHASRLVVPASQRARPISYGSHRDRAGKALAKLAGPHLPATLKQLKKAIDATDREYDNQIVALSDRGHDAGGQEQDSPDSDADDLGDSAMDEDGDPDV